MQSAWEGCSHVSGHLRVRRKEVGRPQKLSGGVWLSKAEIWMVHLIPQPFNHSGKTLKQWLLLSEPVSLSVEWCNSVCWRSWLLLTRSTCFYCSGQMGQAGHCQKLSAGSRTI